MKKISLLLFGLTFFLSIGVVGSRIVKQGMFMDGLLYATVSHNLAHNIGSFWSPVFNPLEGYFYDKPPLGFFIQSIFFRILGCSQYVERLYSFLTMLIIIFLMSWVWKEVTLQEPFLKFLHFLPSIFLLTTPVVGWSYANNMLENTLTIFAFMGVIFAIKSIKNFYYIPLALFLTMCAFLTKGPQGTFPLVAPVIYSIAFYKRVKLRNLLCSVIIVILFLIMLVFLFLWSDARVFLVNFLVNQVWGSIQNVSNVESRFYLWFRLFGIELLPVEICLGIVLLYKFTRKARVNVFEFFSTSTVRWALFFLLVGMSASLPLIITKAQRGFYLITSFPYYHLSFSLIIGNLLKEELFKMEHFFRWQYVKIVLIICIFFALILFFNGWGKFARDEIELYDIAQISKVVPPFSIVSVSKELYYSYNFHEYLMRFYFIMVDRKEMGKFSWIITTDTVSARFGPNWEKINIQTKRYYLWKKN